MGKILTSSYQSSRQKSMEVSGPGMFTDKYLQTFKEQRIADFLFFPFHFFFFCCCLRHVFSVWALAGLDLLCRPGWPPTLRDPGAGTRGMCTMPGSYLLLLSLFFFVVFEIHLGLSTSVVLNLPTPETLYFDTAPHVVVTPSHKIILIATP